VKVWAFGHSSLIRHSDFVIRHSPHPKPHPDKAKNKTTLRGGGSVAAPPPFLNRSRDLNPAGVVVGQDGHGRAVRLAIDDDFQ
jgi:hypothetical protein